MTYSYKISKLLIYYIGCCVNVIIFFHYIISCYKRTYNGHNFRIFCLRKKNLFIKKVDEGVLLKIFCHCWHLNFIKNSLLKNVTDDISWHKNAYLLQASLPPPSFIFRHALLVYCFELLSQLWFMQLSKRVDVLCVSTFNFKLIFYHCGGLWSDISYTNRYPFGLCLWMFFLFWKCLF